MHAKLSILIIIFMVLIPTTIIAISSGKRTVVKAANSGESKTESYAGGKSFPFEKEWNGPFSTKTAIQKPSTIPLEEDGNHHYFHFRRFRRSRYREIFKVIGKILLLIIHFSLLLCSYLHCLH